MQASTVVSQDHEIVGLYRLPLVVGNVGVPGAPLLHVQALVDAPSGRIVGHARVTQAIAPPNGEIVIDDLKGQIRDLGFGPSMRVVTLTGSYGQEFPPPAIGSILLEFSATLAVPQNGWDGRGSFEYGGHEVADVPVAIED